MLIYCDGACVPNPGYMGAGIVPEDETTRLSLFLGPGTNQLAEIRALLESLQLANSGDSIFSDSRYAINLTLGLWRPSYHVEVVSELRGLFERKHITLKWIRGHDGHRLQELADRLANRAATVRRSTIDSPTNLLSRSGLGGFGRDESEIRRS